MKHQFQLQKQMTRDKSGYFYLYFGLALFVILLFVMPVQFSAWAGEEQAKEAAPKIQFQKRNPDSARQKIIDFDGDLVEGMNKSPYDSLNQVSESQKKRKRFHLYRKRKGFRTEIRETLKKMRYVQ